MKTKKIIFWTTTALMSAGMLMSSVMYLTHNPKLVEGFKLLGLPMFMINLLGVAKLLGALALIQPFVPKLREWAYAGFTFVLTGALWAHLSTSTPFAPVLVFGLLLAVSYILNVQLAGAKAKV